MCPTMSDSKYGLRIPSVTSNGISSPSTFAITLGDLLKSPLESKKAEDAATFVLENASLFGNITFHVTIDKVTKEGEPRSREVLDITGEALIARATFIHEAIPTMQIKWGVEFVNDASILRRTNRGVEKINFLSALQAATTPAATTPAKSKSKK